MKEKFVNQYKSMNGYKLDVILASILTVGVFFLLCIIVPLEAYKGIEMPLFLFFGIAVAVAVICFRNVAKLRPLYLKIPNSKLSITQVTVSMDEDSILYADSDGIKIALKWGEIKGVKRLQNDQGLWFLSEKYNIYVEARFFTKGNMVDLIHFLESKHLNFEAL